MRKKCRKTWNFLLAAMVLSMALCGCGKSGFVANDMAVEESVMAGTTGSFDGGWDGGEFTDDMVVEEGSVKDTTVDAPQVQDNRKLIKTVDMTVETKEFDAFLPHIQTRVNALGGYIENMETYNGSKYTTYYRNRNAYMTIRIPKDNLDTFLNDISEYSNVINRSENVKDITLTYVDLESHKKVLLVEQERLLELMEKAETIDDIIVLESRLSDIRYQIESMEAQLRTYDNKVNYSTVTLNIQEVKELTPVEEETMWEEITSGFADTLKDLRDSGREFIVWFIVNIPYLCLWAILIVVIIVVGKRIAKKRRAKSAEEITNVKK